MPMYQYACDDCGFDFEHVQSFHDEPLSECPECAGTVRRVISSVGVIFKGSGWYITDSRRQITGAASGDKSASDGEKADTSTAGGISDGATDGKGETEPAADGGTGSAKSKGGRGTSKTSDGKSSSKTSEPAPA